MIALDQPKLYLDFDGTVVTHSYPDIGAELRYCKEVLEKLSHYYIIVNTYRANIGKLDEALAYLDQVGIRYDNVLPHKIDPQPWATSVLHPEVLFIDDIAPGMPLQNGSVDWFAVALQLEL